MPPLPFVKMQGLGNDFILVDLRDGKPRDWLTTLDDPAVVRRLCDRRFGIGADGVLLALPSSLTARARMRVLNADGSEAEMCGNGLRCLARYLWEHDASARPAQQIAVATGAGLLTCTVFLSAADRVESIEIAMGPPRLARGDIPMLGSPGEEAIDQRLQVAGRSFPITAVSLGNPHAIIFVPEGEPLSLRELAERYGPAIERDPLFPGRTNVEFARLRPAASSDAVRGLDLVVWERGCGITLACGTGACATAVAACRTGRFAVGDPLDVHLPGGALRVRVAEGYRDVFMRGPAQVVFRGELDLAPLLSS